MTTPAGQRWTRNKPTEPGWYWVRGSWCSEQVVNIRWLKGWDHPRLIACFVEQPMKMLLDEVETGEWQGPLIPNEATE